jgi:hypothetical protein
VSEPEEPGALVLTRIAHEFLGDPLHHL